MEYHFKIHKENKGYWAECIELEGCITQADSMDELQNNMRNALNLYIAESDDSAEYDAQVSFIQNKNGQIDKAIVHLGAQDIEAEKI